MSTAPLPADMGLTLKEEAAQFLDYWELHGTDPDAVLRFAVYDLLHISRRILEDD